MKTLKQTEGVLAEIREHYEIEKELATKLRNASKDERKYLYTSLYNELFQRVPKHPLLTQKANPEKQYRAVARKMNLLKHFLKPEMSFLEVGPGDCSLSFNVAKHVKKVYAVDVSNEITDNSVQPVNFQLIISDGSSIPVPDNSIDIVYSDNVIEHLHPDDACDQLKHIYKALIPGGVFICITPNRLYGPNDISKYFDQVATGFHLKEYTITELVKLLKTVGFTKFWVKIVAREFVLPISCPAFPFILIEALLSFLPTLVSRKISYFLLIRTLLGIRIVATK